MRLLLAERAHVDAPVLHTACKTVNLSREVDDGAREVVHGRGELAGVLLVARIRLHLLCALKRLVHHLQPDHAVLRLSVTHRSRRVRDHDQRLVTHDRTVVVAPVRAQANGSTT